IGIGAGRRQGADPREGERYPGTSAVASTERQVTGGQLQSSLWKGNILQLTDEIRLSGEAYLSYIDFEREENGNETLEPACRVDAGACRSHVQRTGRCTNDREGQNDNGIENRCTKSRRARHQYRFQIGTGFAARDR